MSFFYRNQTPDLIFPLDRFQTIRYTKHIGTFLCYNTFLFTFGASAIFQRDNRIRWQRRHFPDRGLFAGEQVVSSSDLMEASENYTEFRKDTNQSSSTSRTRDVKKILSSGTELRVLAIEDQSYMDPTMPWRCMNYDTLEYGRQVQEIQAQNKKLRHFESSGEKLSRFQKTDRLAPVYTVCLYHGTDPWDGPRSLKEMMQFGNDPEATFWKNQFMDYGMRLICVNELEDASAFTTQLKELFAIMAYRKDKQEMRKFLETHKEYQHLDEETARVIGTVMGVHTFMNNQDKYEKEGEYNMCQAIREMVEEEIESATLNAIKNLMDSMKWAATQSMSALKIPAAEQEKYLRMLDQ